VLFLAAARSATFFRQVVAPLELFEFLFEVHSPQIIGELAITNR
jgi:hypothetical protein